MTTPRDGSPFVTPSNCLPVIGASWTWVKRFARKHGVPVLRIGRKSYVPVELLVDAMKVAASSSPTPQTVELELERRRAAERTEYAAQLAELRGKARLSAKLKV